MHIAGKRKQNALSAKLIFDYIIITFVIDGKSHDSASNPSGGTL